MLDKKAEIGDMIIAVVDRAAGVSGNNSDLNNCTGKYWWSSYRTCFFS